MIGSVLLGIFIATNAGYFYLDPESSRFAPWLALYTLQFGLLAAILRFGSPALSHVVAAGIVSRAILWFTIPVLEADYFRYLWDGHVWAHGINPFMYPPEHPALDNIETGYRFFITYADYSTIYPPVAQFFFRLTHVVAPDSLFGLKVALTLFDVATGWVLLHWVQDASWRLNAAALYFLNPLVLKEVANSAHLDPVPVFFATAAIFWMTRRGPSPIPWLLLALSIGAKLYSIALVPLFARSDAHFKRHGLIALAALLLLYLPFADAGRQLFAGTAAFGQFWIFNASLFRLVAGASALVAPDVVLLPRILVGLTFAGLVLWCSRRLSARSDLPRACLFTIGALLLLSPVVDAWYVLWILPLAIVERSVPWLAFTYLVGLSYAWFHSPALSPYLGTVEYLTLFALLWRHRGSIVDR